MAQEFAQTFYNSVEWKTCREEYKRVKRYLCENCLNNGILTPGEIVHHIIKITPNNVNDPNVTLNFDNLRLVCRKCHADEHNQRQRRFKILEDGTVVTGYLSMRE